MIFVDKLLEPHNNTLLSHPAFNPQHPDDWMRINESLIQSLTEMSVSREDMKKILYVYHYNPRFWHLLKLFYFRDNQRDFNGWTTSVWKGLASIPKLKNPNGKDKLPDAQFIYNWVWGNFEDSFEDWHEGALKDFNDKSNPEFRDLLYIHARGDADTAGAFVKEYHLWLAKKLAKQGWVTKADVQSEIEELLRKYPYRSK